MPTLMTQVGQLVLKYPNFVTLTSSEDGDKNIQLQKTVRRHLETVGDFFFVEDNPSLESLEGLDSLTTVAVETDRGSGGNYGRQVVQTVGVEGYSTESTVMRFQSGPKSVWHVAQSRPLSEDCRPGTAQL